MRAGLEGDRIDQIELALRIGDVLTEVVAGPVAAQQEISAEGIGGIGVGREELGGCKRDRAAEVVEGAEALAGGVAVVEAKAVCDARGDDQSRARSAGLGARVSRGGITERVNTTDVVRRRVVVAAKDRQTGVERVIDPQAGGVQCRCVGVGRDELRVAEVVGRAVRDRKSVEIGCRGTSGELAELKRGDVGCGELGLAKT